MPKMPSSTSTSDKNRRSRITAACAVCRAKRQKCSGSKPQCDQCRMHNEECWWSDQKKRGPAKDYLRSLQDRLQDTERLLLSVLPLVPDESLGAVLQADAANGPSHQAWTSSLSGPEYWSRFPLNRLDRIREWQDHRAAGVPNQSPYSNQPAPNSTVPQHSEVARKSASSPGQASMQRDNMSQHENLSGQTTTSGGWAQSRSTTLDERRYSEETRDACEALFSISNPRPPETKRAYDPPESLQNPYPAAGDTTALPSKFPKHLFW